MRNKLLGASVLIAASLLFSAGLAGCKPGEPPVPEHEHENLTGWQTSPETHWHECKICQYHFVEEKHIYADVTGGECTVYATEGAIRPMLHLTASEGETRELYIKEAWVFNAGKEGRPGKLRVAYSTGPDGTFNGYEEVSGAQLGWQKITFPQDGLRLLTYSYIRLQAITMDFDLGEIVFVANDSKGTGENVLLTPELVGLTGQQLSNYKAVIDAQYFPGEKRECYICHYPEPKTQE